MLLRWKHQTWNNMPMVDCPHCRKEFQWDDYYDIKPGDTKECLYCEKVIHVIVVDTVTSTLDTEAWNETCWTNEAGVLPGCPRSDRGHTEAHPSR